MMKTRWTSLLAAALLVGAVACGDDDPKGNNTAANNQTTNNSTTNNSTSPNSTSPNSTTPNNNSGVTADVQEVEPNGFAEGDTPTPFDAGQSIGGTIAEGTGEMADVDRFSFTAEAGQVLTVSIESQGEGLQDLGESQIGMFIVSEDETVIRQFLGNEGLDSREVFLPLDGTYFIEVSDIRSQEMLVGGEDATYVIGTSLSSPEPDSLDVPGTVNGDLGDGTISAFTISVAETSAVQLETFAGRLDTPSGVDTVLYVFDPAAAALVALNDDIDFENDIYDSATVFEAEAGTDYLVVVDAFNATESGDFRLDSSTTDDAPSLPGVLAAGETLSGEIGEASGDEFDTDYFEVTLERNEVVTIEVVAEGQLQPNVRVLFNGTPFAEARPVNGTAALDLAAGDFEDPQTFLITVDDFRNTPPDEATPQNVGGNGFGYDITISETTWTPSSVTIPYNDTGVIDAPGALDWYSFDVPAGDVLIANVITTETGFVPQLVLLNDQNFDQPIDAPYIAGSAEGQTFTIGVRDEFYRGFAAAEYLLEFSTVTPSSASETEPNDDAENANSLTPPVAVTGVTDGTNDTATGPDFYTFTTDGPDTVKIFTSPGADENTDDADTVLTLLDSDGTELATNDDVALGNTFSEITYQVDAAGTYTIRLEPFCTDAECSNGDYTMTLVVE